MYALCLLSLLVCLASAADVKAGKGPIRPPPGPPLPPFLNGLPSSAVAEFNKIIHDEDATRAEAAERLKAFAAKYDIEDEVATHEAASDSKLIEHKMKVDEAIAELPTAYKKWSETIESYTLTRSQIHERLDRLVASWSPQLRALVHATHPSMLPPGPPTPVSSSRADRLKQ